MVGRLRERHVNLFQAQGSMQNELTDYGRVTFFFGIFCAYWAQTTGRSAWVWFFLGLTFGPLAGVVLLHLNAKDRGDRVLTERPR